MITYRFQFPLLAATLTAITFSASAQSPTEKKADAPAKAVAEESDDTIKSSGKIVGEVHAEIAKLRLVIESIGNLQAHTVRLQEANAKQKAAMAAIQKESASHKQALTALNEKHKQATEQLAAAKRTNAEQVKAVETLKAAEAAKAAFATQLATALQQAEAHAEKAKQAEQLSLQVQSLKSQSSKASEEQARIIASLKAQLAEKEKQFSALNAQLKTAVTQSNSLKSAVETTEIQATIAKTETCNIAKTLADARSELAILNKKLESLANVELIKEPTPTEKEGQPEK